MLGMSRMVSVVMLLVYGAYLFFQLVTHTFLFEDEDDDEEEEAVLGLYGSIGWCARRPGWRTHPPPFQWQAR